MGIELKCILKSAMRLDGFKERSDVEAGLRERGLILIKKYGHLRVKEPIGIKGVGRQFVD